MPAPKRRVGVAAAETVAEAPIKAPAKATTAKVAAAKAAKTTAVLPSLKAEKAAADSITKLVQQEQFKQAASEIAKLKQLLVAGTDKENTHLQTNNKEHVHLAVPDVLVSPSRTTKPCKDLAVVVLALYLNTFKVWLDEKHNVTEKVASLLGAADGGLVCWLNQLIIIDSEAAIRRCEVLIALINKVMQAADKTQDNLSVMVNPLLEICNILHDLSSDNRTSADNRVFLCGAKLKLLDAIVQLPLTDAAIKATLNALESSFLCITSFQPDLDSDRRVVAACYHKLCVKLYKTGQFEQAVEPGRLACTIHQEAPAIHSKRLELLLACCHRAGISKPSLSIAQACSMIALASCSSSNLSNAFKSWKITIEKGALESVDQSVKENCLRSMMLLAESAGAAGSILMQKDLIELAVRITETSCSISPDDTCVLYADLGWAWDQLHCTERAQYYFNRAIEQGKQVSAAAKQYANLRYQTSWPLPHPPRSLPLHSKETSVVSGNISTSVVQISEAYIEALQRRMEMLKAFQEGFSERALQIALEILSSLQQTLASLGSSPSSSSRMPFVQLISQSLAAISFLYLFNGNSSGARHYLQDGVRLAMQLKAHSLCGWFQVQQGRLSYIINKPVTTTTDSSNESNEPTGCENVIDQLLFKAESLHLAGDVHMRTGLSNAAALECYTEALQLLDSFNQEQQSTTRSLLLCKSAVALVQQKRVEEAIQKLQSANHTVFSPECEILAAEVHMAHVTGQSEKANIVSRLWLACSTAYRTLPTYIISRLSRLLAVLLIGCDGTLVESNAHIGAVDNVACDFLSISSGIHPRRQIAETLRETHTETMQKIFDLYQRECPMISASENYSSTVGQIIKHLPTKWTTIIMTMLSSRQTMMVTSLQHNSAPMTWIMHIQSVAFDQFKAIIIDSDATIAQGNTLDTKDQQKRWWSSRQKCDRALESLLQQTDSHFEPLRELLSKSDHTVLVLDKGLQQFPWESIPILRSKSVSRVPALSFLRDRLLLSENNPNFKVINKQNTAFLINPSGDLVATEEKFKTVFANQSQWTGVIGKPPTPPEAEAFLEKDLFLYFGHGSGEQFTKADRFRRRSCCAVSCLVGCSSGLLREQGELDPSGHVLNYLCANSPAVVANLWDVTDKDIDRFSECLLTEWGVLSDKGSSLCEAVAAARSACKLPFINGAAPVVYGIPVFVNL